MGNCTTSKPKQRKNIPPHLTVPEDVYLYNPDTNHSLITHYFQCVLYNVKLVGFTQQQAQIIFYFPGLIKLLLPKKSGETSKEINWENRCKFNISGNDYQIRTNFIEIDIMNGQDTNIGHLQINSYQSMIGPSHNDFLISHKNGKQTRLIFDLKISQVIQVEIQSIKTEIEFYKKYYGQKFYFTMKAIVSPSVNKPISEANLNSVSAPSYTQKIELMQSTQFQAQCDNQENQLASGFKYIQSPQKTNSKVSSSKAQSSQMPAFKISMLSSQLLHSRFKIYIWRLIEKQNEQQTSQKLGYMTLFLNPIMQEQPMYLQTNMKKILERSINFDGQILEAHNVQKKLGKFHLQFKIKSRQFFTQKIGSTMTQDGVVNMSYHEIYSSSKNITNKNFEAICKKFDQFMKKYTAMNSTFVEKGQFNSYSSMKKTLRQLASLLYENDKRLQSYFTEEQIEELQERQMNLLKIADQIKNVMQSDDSIANLCWRIQVFIFRRCEFLLKNLGIRQNQKQRIKQNDLDNSIEKRITICLQYQYTIYSLLELNLSSSRINSYSSSDDDDYSEIFRAYCFLTIPIFRQKFLQILSENLQKSKDTSKQNSDREFLLLKMSQNKQQLKGSAIEQNIQTIYDYEENLYKWLKVSPQSELLNNSLKRKIVYYEQFLLFIVNQPSQFFRFVKILMKEFERNEDLKNIPFYQFLPGYTKIVNKIYNEMENTTLEEYFGDEGVCYVSTCLLVNPNLFQPFLGVIFKKTNTFDQLSVMHMLNIVNQYVNYLIKVDKLNSRFPFRYLMKGMKLLLQGHSVKIISKILIFFYNIFNNIGTQFKQTLIMYLLGKVFNSLFYHWSYNVRNIFHHLFLQKISQCQEIHALPQIKERYQTILRIIANTQSINRNWNANSKPQHLKLHQKMKEKFMKQKNSTQKQKKVRKLSDELALNILQDYPIQKQIQITMLKDYIKKQPQNSTVVYLQQKLTSPEINRIIDITNKLQEEQNQGITEQYQLKTILQNQVAYIANATEQFNNLNKNIRECMEEVEGMPSSVLDLKFSMQQSNEQSHSIL